MSTLYEERLERTMAAVRGETEPELFYEKGKKRDGATVAV